MHDYEWRAGWDGQHYCGGHADSGGRGCAAGKFVYGASREIETGIDGGGSGVGGYVCATIRRIQRDLSRGSGEIILAERQQIRAIKGVRDILPPESRAWSRVERAAQEVFATFGFAEIRLPIFEQTEL